MIFMQLDWLIDYFNLGKCPYAIRNKSKQSYQNTCLGVMPTSGHLITDCRPIA